VTVITDITNDIPFGLGPALAPSTAASARVPGSLHWDCAVGGLQFLFATAPERPYRRQTAPFRGARVDNSASPGEQSLDAGYWLRSQSSWHYGSGLASAEPLEINQSEASFRYARGGGVDPWTPGQLSLLNSTSSVQSDAGVSQLLLGVGTGVLHASGTTLRHIATDGTVTAITWGGSVNAITSITTDGTNYYAANSTGIYQGALPSGGGSLIWNTGAATVIRWVKQRLMATVGRGIYELVGAGPSLPTALDAGTGRASGWTWTDISEGPVGIYLSGYVGEFSTVERVTVTSTTTTVLNQPSVVAEMPRGETVQSLYSYVGTYLALGTSKGLRVASLNTDGSLTMGRLVVESADGVVDMVADGSFLYVTVGGECESGDRTTIGGLYRVDLGQNLNDDPLDFAHAADLCAPSGTVGDCTQVTTAGGVLYFVISGVGVFKQGLTYVGSGWIESGRIRMGILESKVWLDLRLLGVADMEGSVVAHASIAGATAPSGWDSVVTVDGATSRQVGSLSGVSPLAQADLYVAVNLIAPVSLTASPLLIGYQVRTAPSPRRSELIQVPLLCHDFETDPDGNRFGYEGMAWDRFSLLKDLEQGSAAVQWLDYTTGESAAAFIESVDSSQIAPPSRGNKGTGRVVNLTLRLV